MSPYYQHNKDTLFGQANTYQWCRSYSCKVFSITIMWFVTGHLRWRLWIWCSCSRISFFSIIFLLLNRERERQRKYFVRWIFFWSFKEKTILINNFKETQFYKAERELEILLFSTQAELAEIIYIVCEKSTDSTYKIHSLIFYILYTNRKAWAGEIDQC